MIKLLSAPGVFAQRYLQVCLARRNPDPARGGGHRAAPACGAARQTQRKRGRARLPEPSGSRLPAQERPSGTSSVLRRTRTRCLSCKAGVGGPPCCSAAASSASPKAAARSARRGVRNPFAVPFWVALGGLEEEQLRFFYRLPPQSASLFFFFIEPARCVFTQPTNNCLARNSKRPARQGASAEKASGRRAASPFPIWREAAPLFR